MNNKTTHVLKFFSLFDDTSFMSADEEGYVNADLLEHLSEVHDSAVLSSPMFVDRKDHYAEGALAIDSNSFLFGLKRLTATLHKKRNAAFAQFTYVGDASSYKSDLRDIVCVSTDTALLQSARELSEHEIEQLPAKFAAAAARAQKSNFDGVVLSVANNNLFVRFLSPVYNHRGEECDGRTLLYKTMSALRAAVGDHFPVLLKLDTTSICWFDRNDLQLLKTSGCDALLLYSEDDVSSQLAASGNTTYSCGLENTKLILLSDD